MKPIQTRSPKHHGFTLTELAIVMLVIGLLLTGILMPLSSQIELQRMQATQRQLTEISDALIGFAVSHTASGNGKPYLPCPDTDGDGTENRADDGSGNCPQAEGNIPWVTLGIGQSDAWDNRFRYRGDSAYTNSFTGFTLPTTASLRVCGNNTCDSATMVANGVPAVILSHGANGAGATNLASNVNAAPTGQDELENTDRDNNFVSRAGSTEAATSGEFDDLVAWLSPHVLANKMITAGRLP